MKVEREVWLFRKDNKQFPLGFKKGAKRESEHFLGLGKAFKE